MSEEWPGPATTAKRIVIALTTFGLSLSLLAAIVAARLFHFAESMILWSIVLLALGGVAGFGAMRRRAPAVMWPALGALSGFVVVTIWSLGPIFAWSTLVLLVAGIADLIGRRSMREAALALACFVVGASGICVAFVCLDLYRAYVNGITVTHAPVVIEGSWVFAAAVATGGAWRLARARWRRASPGVETTLGAFLFAACWAAGALQPVLNSRAQAPTQAVLTGDAKLAPVDVRGLVAAARQEMEGWVYRVSYDRDPRGADVQMGSNGRPRFLRIIRGEDVSAAIVGGDGQRGRRQQHLDLEIVIEYTGRFKELERENRELKRTNEILRNASA